MPGLPSSVGFRPGAVPLFPRAGSRCRTRPATSRAHRHPETAPASTGAGQPRRRPPATHPAAAKSSCAAAAHLGTRQMLLLHAPAQNQHDAGQRSSGRGTRPTICRLFKFRPQKRLNHRPVVVGYETSDTLPTRSPRFCPTLLRRSPSSRRAEIGYERSGGAVRPKMPYTER